MKILLLEDNSTDADLIKRELLSFVPGCTVDIVTTLKSAKELIFRKKQYTVVLLDMNLPDGNGLDLLLEIRQKDLKSAVIILTGSGDEEGKTQFRPLCIGSDPQQILRALRTHDQF